MRVRVSRFRGEREEKGHFSEQVPSLHTSSDSLPHGESLVSFDDHGEEKEEWGSAIFGLRVP